MKKLMIIVGTLLSILISANVYAGESQKVEIALEISEAVTELAQALDKIRAIHSLWLDREYNIGGANEITDADLAGFTDIINDTQLAEYTSLATNLIKFLDNNSPSAYDYQKRIDLIRDEDFDQ